MTAPHWDRFWPKVDASGVCWEWTASLKPNGYGQFGVMHGRSPQLAHRVAYELLVGPIPDGMHVDHLCRNKACVNPDHLEPVTPAENSRRGVIAHSNRARARAQTHCCRGHEFTEENTYYDHDGHRGCITCRRQRSRRGRLQNRALVMEGLS